MRTVKALPLLLVAGLAGCLPAPYGPYYQPTYANPEAQVVKAYCGGKAGPPTGLSTPLAPGVRLQINASDAARLPPMLGLQFRLDPGALVQFQANTLAVGDGTAEVRMPGSLRVSSQARVPADQPIDMVALGPIDPSAWRSTPGLAAPQAVVGTGFAGGVPGTRPDWLVLQWPAIRWADGSMTTFEPVRLEAQLSRSGWLEYRSAQESAGLKDRYAQCIKDTPQRNCMNILQSYENGFTLRAGTATLTGRLLITDPAKPRLDTYIRLELSGTQAWRWAQAHALMTDGSSGAVTQQPLGVSAVTVFHPSLPLTTPLRGPVAATGDAAAYLEVPLQPAAAQHYRIQLPPLDVNGQRVQPLPIELQRRVLDGGIEPFNC